jgi:hypothetical protein
MSIMNVRKPKGFAVSTALATIGVLLAAAVIASPNANANKNHGKSNVNAALNANTAAVAKALGKSKWNVTKGTVTAVDTATRKVIAEVKNSNRRALRNTTVQFAVASDANIRLGQTGFLKIEGLVINAGKRVTLDKVVPGDTLLFASGTSDGAGALTAKKLFVKRTACQINGAVTAVDTAVDPDTLTLTVGSASKNTGLAKGASAMVEAVTGAKVKRDGVSSTWGAIQTGDAAVVKCYVALDGTTKEFRATQVNAYSPGFLSNLNVNSSSSGNTNSNTNY